LGQSDASFKLPYVIKRDQINGLSIRYQFNDLETWTSACKYTLTNMKWILTFCT
jgi:beclin 1